MKLIMILLLSCSMTIQAQVKDSLPVNKLAGVVGKWTIQGMEDRFLEICEMYTGGYFIVCNSEQKSKKTGRVSKGVSIIGFAKDSDKLTYYHYGSNGSSQVLTGNVLPNGFYFEGEEKKDGKVTRNRVNMIKVGDNYNFREEISIDSGPWNESANFVYVKVK